MRAATVFSGSAHIMLAQAFKRPHQIDEKHREITAPMSPAIAGAGTCPLRAHQAAHPPRSVASLTCPPAQRATHVGETLRELLS